ncbi:MAG: hypothetical protein H0W90_08100 [Actinobacteria bacterium]|nr:hypothetical protein [Actinomycetota bacterium]
MDERLVEQFCEEAQAHGRSSWRLGDLALELVPEGRAGLAELEDKSGLALVTIERYRFVAKAWPTAQRNEALSFSVHATFASAEKRFELIRARSWTVSEAQNELSKLSASGEYAPKRGPAPKAPAIQLLSKRDREVLRRAAGGDEEKAVEIEKMGLLTPFRNLAVQLHELGIPRNELERELDGVYAEAAVEA